MYGPLPLTRGVAASVVHEPKYCTAACNMRSLNRLYAQSKGRLRSSSGVAALEWRGDFSSAPSLTIKSILGLRNFRAMGLHIRCGPILRCHRMH